MISYDGLWAMMKKRGISKYALIHQYHISPGQLTRLKRNENLSTHTLEVFCKILRCQIGDIAEYVEEKSQPDG